ncbi:transposase family protein [Streptomyces tanashiensis]|uniref:helix-turn-helix domain-containing protein n=1 Tax=Streptomyces tanashiensis TaxID=67367 RepID=UPI0036EBAE2E
MVDHGRVVGTVTRAVIISNRRVTGLSVDVIAELVAELGPLWHERHQARLASRPRTRAVGAGAKHRFVFVDRLLAALVHLRHWATHDVLACWFGVDRSTITRAIGEVRPLLAERGCTISPGVRLIAGRSCESAVTRSRIRDRWPPPPCFGPRCEPPHRSRPRTAPPRRVSTGQQLHRPEHHFFHGPNCQPHHTPYGSIPGIFPRTRSPGGHHSECMLHGK